VAASLFDGCGKCVHAAKCLAAAGHWAEAAERFRVGRRWDEASTAFLQCGQPRLAADCFERGGHWSRALRAWEKAGDADELLACARRALSRGAKAGHEECIPFVRRALDALPTAEAVREAVILLGGPEGPEESLVDFLSELGADAAALRIAPESRRLALGNRAFFQSVKRGRPDWELLPEGPDGTALDHRALAALLFGLQPCSIAQKPTGCMLESKPASESEVAVAVRLLLVDPKAVVSVATATSVGSSLVSEAMLLGAAEAMPLKLGALSCVAVPAGRVALHALPLGEAWEAAPTAHVLTAVRAHVLSAIAGVISHSSEAGVCGSLRAVLALPFAPVRLKRSLVEKHAMEVWHTYGPQGAEISELSDLPLVPELLVAASDAYHGKASSIERAFKIMSAEWASQHLFLEIRGAQRHERLLHFAACLRSGVLDDAAWALVDYLEAVEVPPAFALELASYLVGPCTVALQPDEGSYVLEALMWEWPAQLLPGDLREPLQRLSEDLSVKPHTSKMSCERSCERSGDKKRLPRLNVQVEDEPETWRSRMSDDVQELYELVHAQLSYSLGWDISEHWWSAAWSAELTHEALTSAAAEQLRASMARAQADELLLRKRRRWAAGRICRWAARSCRPDPLWPAVCRAAAALRATASPAQAESLVSVVRSALEGLEGSAKVEAAALELLALDRETRRRQEAASEQREIERTRAARERADELRRLRGLRRQAALERKAQRVRGRLFEGRP